MNKKFIVHKGRREGKTTAYLLSENAALKKKLMNIKITVEMVRQARIDVFGEGKHSPKDIAIARSLTKSLKAHLNQ